MKPIHCELFFLRTSPKNMTGISGKAPTSTMQNIAHLHEEEPFSFASLALCAWLRPVIQIFNSSTGASILQENRNRLT